MPARCVRHRVVSVGVSLAVVALSVSPHAAPAARADTGGDTEPTTASACGVERWSVKTGTDRDARLVNLAAATPTNIIQLRALPAPSQPPLAVRVQPTETTVWALDAILLRYKQEADSDYHLVLADTGGRTMIAEVPAPACVGGGSPFLPAIRAVRQAFTQGFHPTIAWQRVSVPVHVTGVGFFDFKHGQSGVAPNAIELHPVISIHWGGSPLPVPPAMATALPPAVGGVTMGGGVAVRVQVSLSPIASGSLATVVAMTVANATCTVSVRYPSGRVAGGAELRTVETADTTGRVAWSWRLARITAGMGMAMVQCVLGRQDGTGTASFTIQ